MMSGEQDDLLSFIDKFRDEFNSLPPEDIALARSVNGLRKFKSDTDVFKGMPVTCSWISYIIFMSLRKTGE